MRGFVRTFKNSELFSRISVVGGIGGQVYGLLLDMADWRYGRVILSHAEMAEMVGKSVRTVERVVKDLSEQGLVKYRRGVYAINPEFAWAGRSWNIKNASYFVMGGDTGTIVSIVEMVREANRERLERETFREVARSAHQKTEVIRC